MGYLQEVKSEIDFNINQNGNQEITGKKLNKVLNKMVVATENEIAQKQDKILDLEKIREDASKGATALQSVPSEYVTEEELNAKGYATKAQVAGKQDVLVSGSNIKTINGENILGSGNIVIKGGTDVDTSKFATKEEVAKKQDIITDLSTIRSNAAKGASIIIDTEISETSENPIANKAVSNVLDAVMESLSAAFVGVNEHINEVAIAVDNKADKASVNSQIANKQDVLISNINIKTINGESVLGSGNIIVEADTTNLATKTELNGVSEAVAGKQDALVSGTNVKTINGKSILGGGNLDVSVIVDTAFSETSENPLQNKVITPVLAAKADVTYVDSAIAAAITNVLNTEV